MTIARGRQVCLSATPYYHCISRCVRRAYLCGLDRFSGRSFEHRRGWIEKRLQFLASVFAVDLCAYAVMSNHYHVVVRIDQAQAESWSDAEVIGRWLKLYRGPPLVRRHLAGAVVTVAERQVIAELIAIWRERLMNLGWFMRNINETIARRANAEDGCTGRFWEGRYKCQALLDEKALLTCMAYVDLNPIRAALAETPETSSYTAIRARIEGRDTHLARFLDEARSPEQVEAYRIPFSSSEYLGLVDWTGRAIRNNKPGAIHADLPPIFGRLQISVGPWLSEIKHYGSWYGRAVGAVAKAREYCEATGTRWVKGIANRGNKLTTAFS